MQIWIASSYFQAAWEFYELMIINDNELIFEKKNNHLLR